MALLTLFGATAALEKQRVSNDRIQVVNGIELLQDKLVTNALDYIWSGNVVRRNEYNANRATLEKQLASFQPREEDQEKFNALKKELSLLRDILDKMLGVADSSTSNGDLIAQTLWKQEGSKQSATAQVITRELIQHELSRAGSSYNQARSDADGTAILISTLTGLALLVAIGLALLLTAALIGPLSQLRIRLADLAKGDLTQPVQIVNQDELGELGSTFNTTLSSLRALVRQLYEQSRYVSTATDALTEQAQSQVSGSSEQAGAIEEATASLQELSLIAVEIARLASNAVEEIEKSLEQSRAISLLTEEMVLAYEQGRNTVAQTIRAIQNLKEELAAIEGQQRALLTQSAAIQSITELIESIARETHLLALNAAIEAAGAGESGNRFAVIAGEVKNLAARSQGATVEVRTALNSVADSVAQVSQRSKQSLVEAESAVEDAEKSDHALLVLAGLSEQIKTAVNEIVLQVEGTASLASNIGAVTQQQQISSKAMFEKIVTIGAVTTQNLASIKQGQVVTQQLNYAAGKLEQSADAFKLTI